MSHWRATAMPTNAIGGNITTNHSEKNSSDSSSPIDGRTAKDTTFEVEENHRLVWEEDCNSSNVDSLSDLGFVPSDFDPTPLDKLLSSSKSDQEEEVEQLYAFRAILDSLEGIADFTFPPTSNEEDSSNFNTYGSLDTSVDGEELSIYSTSDFASVHSDIFESSWHQHLEDLETLQSAFSLLTTRDTGHICTVSVVGKEEETSSNTNRPLKLTMSHETEIINRDVTCSNEDITTGSGSCNALNEEETAERSSVTTEAQHFTRAFQNEKITQRSFLGHKETIFSVKFSSCQRFVATASQEATIKLWNVKSNRCVATLAGHHREYECLRVAWAPSDWTDHLFFNLTSTSSRETIIMASSSANGIVKIWSIALTGSTIQKTQCVATIDHGSSLEEENIPQVYALQFITHWMGADTCTNHHNLLLTSADDEVHLWEIINEDTNLTNVDDSKTSSANEREDFNRICYRRMLSYRFVCIENGNGGVILNIGSDDEENQSFSDLLVSPGLQNKFGGERNPKGLIFVFDASHCKSNGCLAVALADGTTRVINSRGVCLAILQLPGCKSHLTAVCWDAKGYRISTSVGTGQIILWRLEPTAGDDAAFLRRDCTVSERVTPSCQAVLQGGHEVGRPLFGTQYCGFEDEDLLLSWGVDGRLCLWDSRAKEYSAPLGILVSRPDYPIYTVDVMKQEMPRGGTAITTLSAKETEHNTLIRIAVAGGRESGFVGMPFYLYTVKYLKT